MHHYVEIIWFILFCDEQKCAKKNPVVFLGQTWICSKTAQQSCEHLYWYHVSILISFTSCIDDYLNDVTYCGSTTHQCCYKSWMF